MHKEKAENSLRPWPQLFSFANSRRVALLFLEEKHSLLKMIKVKLAEIFPTFTSTAIFVAYMVLSINLGLLVTASRHGSNKYPYNTSLVVLLAESIKIIIATATYCKQ